MSTPQSNVIELRPIQYPYPPQQPNVTYTSHAYPPSYAVATQPPPYYVTQQQQHPNYYPPTVQPVTTYAQPTNSPVLTPMPMIMTTAASIPITTIKPKR